MKQILSLFAPCFFGSVAFAQKQTAGTFVRLTTASGTAIAGDAVDRGYERWITANTLATSGKKNEMVTFSMNLIGAAADLKRALNNNETLPTAEVTVLRPMTGDGRQLPAYVIKMEGVKVTGCTEGVGCNGGPAATVTLQAARIGWIYYDTNKPTLTVLNKYGYDVAKGVDWTAF